MICSPPHHIGEDRPCFSDLGCRTTHNIVKLKKDTNPSSSTFHPTILIQRKAKPIWFNCQLPHIKGRKWFSNCKYGNKNTSGKRMLKSGTHCNTAKTLNLLDNIKNNKKKTTSGKTFACFPPTTWLLVIALHWILKLGLFFDKLP